MGDTRYDRLPYKTFPYRQAHPDQLAVCALLHGIEPPALEGARVLDLGCGAGGHLIALCAGWPDVQAVGVDLAPTAIAAGCELAAAAGIENVRLEVGDLADLADGGLGEFDYVIAYGIYAWVPDEVRELLPRAIRSHLAPNGLGLISFNSQPGGHMKAILRDAAKWHGRSATTEEEALARARELIELLDRWRASELADDPWGQALLHMLPPMVIDLGGALVHDLLSPAWNPTWYADFAAHIAGHDLRPVGEARLLEPTNLPRGEDVRELIGELSGGDPIAREQLVDFLGLGHFRETVVAPAGATPAAEPDTHALARMRFIAPESVDQRVAPELAGVLEALSAQRPLTTPFDELAEATGLAHEALQATLLEGIRRGLLTAWVRAPAAAPAGPRPTASWLARVQAARGEACYSLLHSLVPLDEGGRALLGLLDGTRDMGEIAQALSDALGVEVTGGQLSEYVTALGRGGLLEA